MVMWNLVYLLPLLLAASALAADQDHDGIPDDWETNGVTVTLPDGHTRFLDLRSMGASPNHKDIIVWVNWMEAPDHTHKPIANGSKAPGTNRAIELNPLDLVKAAFLKQGINLIVIYGEHPIAETPQIGDTDHDGNYLWDALDDLTKTEFPVLPAGFGRAVHLCTFIHQMGGQAHAYTGLSQSMPGREFLVALGGSADHTGSASTQEGTFMHELGHDLGLHHGGADDILLKPNYLSVMNYLFQVTGLYIDGTFGNFDYSSKRFDFDETAVDGRKGVTTDKSLAHFGSAEVCDPFFNKFRYFSSVNDPLRWDCTSNPPTASMGPKDVNKDNAIGALPGWNDWNSVLLAPFVPGAGAPVFTSPKPTDELAVNRIANILAGLTVPTVSVERGVGGISIKWGRVPLDSVVAYEVLRSDPAGRKDIVRQTNVNLFLDTTAKPGVDYSYQVRMVFNGPTAQAIDAASASLERVQKLLSDNFRAAIPLRQRVADILMRGQLSQPLSAGK
jgi:hypothetical protein